MADGSAWGPPAAMMRSWWTTRRYPSGAAENYSAVIPHLHPTNKSTHTDLVVPDPGV